MAVADVQTARVVQIFKKNAKVVKIIQRFADAHDNDVGHARVCVCESDLRKHFARRQIALFTQKRTCAKAAAHAAARLRRDADAVAVLVFHDDGLDKKPVRKREKILRSAVLGVNEAAAHFKRGEGAVLMKFFAQRLRNIRHAVKRHNAAAQPRIYLLCTECGFAEGLDILFEVGKCQ